MCGGKNPEERPVGTQRGCTIIRTLQERTPNSGTPLEYKDPQRYPECRNPPHILFEVRIPYKPSYLSVIFPARLQHSAERTEEVLIRFDATLWLRFRVYLGLYVPTVSWSSPFQKTVGKEGPR